MFKNLTYANLDFSFSKFLNEHLMKVYILNRIHLTYLNGSIRRISDETYYLYCRYASISSVDITQFILSVSRNSTINKESSSHF